MERKLTSEEKKILKVFTLICRSYGTNTVHKSFNVEYGKIVELGWDLWYKEWGGGITEQFPDVDGVIEKIFYDNKIDDVFEMTDDDHGRILVYIDCVEKKIEITVEYDYLSTKENGADIEIDGYENLNIIFEEMKERGFSEGIIDFNGSGDSGEINSYIEYENGDLMKLNSSVENDLYNILENHMGGWEINEGSQGKFIFTFNEEKGIKKVYLDFYENLYETKSLGTRFYDTF